MQPLQRNGRSSMPIITVAKEGGIMWDYMYYPSFPLPRRTRVKQLGIYELPTTNVSLSDTSVDYGIDRCLYNELPCECYISLLVSQAVPAGGEALPVTVVVPTSGTSTNTGTTSTNGESNTPVVDHNTNPVVGSDLEDVREVFAYLNKRQGIIRFVNFVTGSGAAAAVASTLSE